jgi:hypothetical protein
MPEEVKRNPPGWQPPSFWAPLIGHLMVDIPKVPVEVVLTCVSTLFIPGWGPVHPVMVLAGVILANLAHAVVAVVLERPFQIRGRLRSPGGWGFALVPWLGGSVASFSVMTPLFGVPRGVVIASVVAIVEAAFSIWMREWRPGPTDAEYDEKWARTKEMTKDVFAPDVAEIRRRLDERAMEGYRRKIAERERDAEIRRQEDGRRPHP